MDTVYYAGCEPNHQLSIKHCFVYFSENTVKKKANLSSQL